MYLDNLTPVKLTQCLVYVSKSSEFVLEVKMSFLFLKVMKINMGYAVFRQQNSVGFELLFSLRWRDRLLFASSSWFVNNFLTTCMQMNQPSSCHLALLYVIFSFLYEKP